VKQFALIGASGYIAPRHMKAIHETGNNLVAAFDPNDSVGIMDRYFPNADFFTEFERFDRHIDKRRRAGSPIDYVSICSPNYLHDSHTRSSLRAGADAICEKPLVLNPWSLDNLIEFEEEMDNKVNTILQLRLHPSIQAIHDQYSGPGQSTKAEVDLTYITPRGNWYFHSWKGDKNKSGGIATNIGVHFFDMLHYVFGKIQKIEVHHASPIKTSGYLEYENARVRWFLSLDVNDIPDKVRASGQLTYRSVNVDKKLIEFSNGFTDLHTSSYQEILAGNGFGLEENRTAIETVATIRNAKICANPDAPHPFLIRLKNEI